MIIWCRSKTKSETWVDLVIGGEIERFGLIELSDDRVIPHFSTLEEILIDDSVHQMAYSEDGTWFGLMHRPSAWIYSHRMEGYSET